MISNCLNLTKLFMKSLQMGKVTGKKNKVIFGFLLASVALFIFLPFILFFGIFMFSMTEQLNEVGYASIGLEMMCFLVAIFTFVFSFSVILNQFYFSEDIPSILPLPLKPEEIVISKFTSCFLAENVMEFLMLLVGVIGYGIAVNAPIGNYILSLIGIFTLPIIPMVYCGSLCLIIMNFTKAIKNKETIRKISIVAVLIVLLFFACMVGTLQNFDFESYVQSFALGNHTVLEYSRVIFPHIQLFVDAFDRGSILSLVSYLLVNVIYVLLFVLLAQRLYLPGVIGLYSQDTKTKSNSTKLLNDLKENSVIKSYLIKELKILFRSPTLFINCVLINFIWPIFVYVIYKVTMSYNLADIRYLIHTDSIYMFKLILLYVIGVSIMIPALNSISASSFSREGKHFSFMKYIPVKYGIQWIVKILCSFIISFIGINLFTTLFFVIAGVPILWCIYYYLISFWIVYFVCCLGIYLDSIQPKLVWDDEINSLRENYNTFMLMGFALLLFAIFVGGGYYIMFKVEYPITNTIFGYILAICFLSYFISIIIAKYDSINIIEQQDL